MLHGTCAMAWLPLNECSAQMLAAATYCVGCFVHRWRLPAATTRLHRTAGPIRPPPNPPCPGGAYSANQPSSAAGMSMHSVTPPPACVSQAGGMPAHC